MSERETIQPQPTETQTEAEKAAEEERRAAQEILENLYDPFTENDWLVHNTALQDLENILQNGILSDDFVTRAQSLKLKTELHKTKGLMSYQDKDAISTFQKITNHIIPDWICLGGREESVGIIFTPLSRDTVVGELEYEKLAKIRVASRRFKLLVIDQKVLEKIIPLAITNKLPLIDRYFNLHYPLSIDVKDLKQITVPRLRELAKTLGIEKLRAMSVEEIKSAADALKIET